MEAWWHNKRLKDTGSWRHRTMAFSILGIISSQCISCLYKIYELDILQLASRHQVRKDWSHLPRLYPWDVDIYVPALVNGLFSVLCGSITIPPSRVTLLMLVRSPLTAATHNALVANASVVLTWPGKDSHLVSQITHYQILI